MNFTACDIPGMDISTRIHGPQVPYWYDVISGPEVVSDFPIWAGQISGRVRIRPQCVRSGWGSRLRMRANLNERTCGRETHRRIYRLVIIPILRQFPTVRLKCPLPASRLAAGSIPSTRLRPTSASTFQARELPNDTLTEKSLRQETFPSGRI